ncbi:MAG: hypothetical protein ABR500_11470 [Dermatophilaceae bacterium]|nr:hypothetical protein [Intrasporangiaceae bacterium]
MTIPTSELRCPACGESDLRGRSAEDGIEVTCAGCGHSWRRQARHCATCGGADVVERDQFLSRNPRGNQTAVVGRRLIRLCPTCDRDALTEADRRSGMVEEEYVSRFLIDPRTLPPPPPRQHFREEARPATRRAAAAAARPRRQAPSPPPQAARATPTDPTLREAIAAFLEGPAEPGDAFVMLLVGRALGPTTRLSALGADAAARLSRAGGGTASASDCAARAVTHWQSRGWPV